MSISENIKKIRNDQRLTQQEFAERIGVKRNTVATYEMGRSEPSDSAVMLICREFGVNPEWIRTGKGEMYVQKETSIIEQLAQEYRLDARSRALVENFLRLSEENRELVITAVRNAARLLQPEEPRKGELTREEIHAMIDRELDEAEAAAKRGTKSSAFTFSSGLARKFGNTS